MPYTAKAKHLFQMAYAMSHGHRIAGLSKETRKNMHEIIASTSDEKLKEMASAPVKKKAKK